MLSMVSKANPQPGEGDLSLHPSDGDLSLGTPCPWSPDKANGWGTGLMQIH